MNHGIFENCEGTDDLAASIRYWHEFGYRPVAEARLSADAAQALYGHAAELTSVRLRHLGTTDYGTLRLLGWSRLRDDGLGTAPPLTVGGRWFLQNCASVHQIADAFDDAAEGGLAVVRSEPIRNAVRQAENPGFFSRRSYAREMMVLTPGHRQAFVQHFDREYDYGRVDHEAPLRTSQFLHSTFIVPDGSGFDFYPDVLDLPIAGSGGGSYGDNFATRVLLVQPGQSWQTRRFRKPDERYGMFMTIWPEQPVPDLRHRSRPGSRGLSLATLRVDDAAATRDRVQASRASNLTPLHNNEFNEPSFSFVAPDGIFWNVLERVKSEE